MGEIINNLGSVRLNDVIYDIELNKPTHSKSNPTVHIQSSTHRLELSLRDFLALCASIEHADFCLKNYKS